MALCEDRSSDDMVGSDLVELAIEILLGSSNFLGFSLLTGPNRKNKTKIVRLNCSQMSRTRLKFGHRMAYSCHNTANSFEKRQRCCQPFGCL